MDNTVDKPLTPYQQKIAEEIKSIYNSIEKISESNIARMREEVFVYYYLPLFVGEENIHIEVSFDSWKRYAGGVFNEVIIIDNNGAELYRVPALFDKDKISPILSGRKISDVMVTAEQYSRIHPNQGRAYLNNELNARAIFMKNIGDNATNKERWNNIFRRYNKPEIISSSEKNIKTQSPKCDNDCFEML